MKLILGHEHVHDPPHSLQVRYHESGSLLPAIAPQLLSDYNSQSSFLESIETQDRIYSFYQTSHDVEH